VMTTPEGAEEKGDDTAKLKTRQTHRTVKFRF